MQTDSLPVFPVSFHKDREAIVLEPHARPPLPISDSEFIVYVGFKCSEKTFEKLSEKLGAMPLSSDVRHLAIENGKVRMKLERHTEFYSLTLITRLAETSTPAMDILRDCMSSSDIEVMILSQVVVSADLAQLNKPLPFGERHYGGQMREDMEVRSTLKPNNEGAILYSVHTKGSSSAENGRRIQRLLEMETYRNMCLLGLSVAREIGVQLSDAEDRLKTIVNSMNQPERENDEDLYNSLLSLAQLSSTLQADTRYRFSASKAYFELAQQRLTSLEEAEVGDLQTITGFVRSRMEPGMATIESTSSRLTNLHNDLSNALSLLRTRIDLGLNRDNQTLLKSMDDRHRQQVLIAQTVEGLSAIAISYYAIGLLSYVIKGYSEYLPFGLSQNNGLRLPFQL